MSDVFRLASQYRNQLRSELARIDDFLLMAHALADDASHEAPMPLTRSATWRGLNWLERPPLTEPVPLFLPS